MLILLQRYPYLTLFVPFQATYWRHLKEHKREVQSLLSSQQWSEAHAVLMNHVLPPLLLAGEGITFLVEDDDDKSIDAPTAGM